MSLILPASYAYKAENPFQFVHGSEERFSFIKCKEEEEVWNVEAGVDEIMFGNIPTGDVEAYQRVEEEIVAVFWLIDPPDTKKLIFPNQEKVNAQGPVWHKKLFDLDHPCHDCIVQSCSLEIMFFEF